MTPEQYGRYLEKRGYSWCGTHRDKTKDRKYRLSLGDRVRVHNRHFGYETGQGTVEAIYYKERPVRKQNWKSDDVEVVVKNDDGTYSLVANYLLSKVEQA